MQHRLLAFGTLLIFGLGSAAVSADEEVPRHLARQFSWENDAYVPGDNTDQFYTNGMRYAWFWNPNREEPKFSLSERKKELLESWCVFSHLCPDADVEYLAGHALGQNMYTPVAIGNPNPQPRDRPWAGYLYFSWIAAMTHFPSNENDVENVFELQLGGVGPHSAAVLAQKAVHNWFDWTPPRGWRHQLRNEPTVNLNYTWRKRIGNETIDVIPGFGVALGTVAVHGSAGAMVRLGKNLSGFPQTLIVPTSDDVRSLRQPKPLEAYVFAGAEGRLVGHNIFLDGNVLVDGPEIQIDRKDFVYDLKAGLTIRYKAIRFDYTWVQRSEEFDSRLRRETDAQFGSATIGWSWWTEKGEQDFVTRPD